MAATTGTTNGTPSGTPAATPAALAQDAATELARLLPSSVPLVPVPFDAAHAPGPDAVAVRASFVGASSADLVVVADAAVAEVLAADDAVSLADALRPALEAAAAVLGPGVLDATVAGPLGAGLVEPGVAAVALAPAPGAEPQAWFAVRVRAHGTTVPQPREGARGADRSALRLLHDVELTLTAEIGRTRLPVRQVLDLVPGTVLELDRAAGAPADVMVNGRLVARGEVVVLDEDYGIRITEIVAHEG
ncbi:MAG: flagellar motor switch protein FliN [Actinomycetales bacterium]|nr:flagellar motor switch protein FliN [Actinomycetales bacterium]